MRYLLLDCITKWVPGVEAEGLKNVSLSEDFFEDHFPLKPIMPGTLIVEGMAQLAGLLLEETMLRKGVKIKALMSAVQRAKFRRPVYPGAQIRYRCLAGQLNELGGNSKGEAVVDQVKVAEAELLFTFHEMGAPEQETRRDAVLSTWLRNVRTS
ncbi:MAG: 3-hydroxyacyl-[acyl-carrier-protein] dehydratase FabZ [Deltaproteobacteria bacterium]|jgi:3-hydroxyacyl-[acyl-carrier-protein] dehydratase|nr:3-hydroxyacyl-[acyl-carrier-protein] dehydratase FabZ [Deltaproteobacteria bacterium]